jgi:hypothetical protein
LRTAFLAEGIRDDLEAAALLDEQTLEQIRTPDRPTMGHRKAQVRNAGFEVVHEARNRAVVIFAIVGHDARRKLAGPAKSTPPLHASNTSAGIVSTYPTTGIRVNGSASLKASRSRKPCT